MWLSRLRGAEFCRRKFGWPIAQSEDRASRQPNENSACEPAGCVLARGAGTHQLRSARGVSELLELSISVPVPLPLPMPVPVDVPLVLALLLVFIDELLAFIDALFPTLLVEEFIDEAFVPSVDEFIDEFDELPLFALLAAEPEPPVAPVAPLVVLEPVLWARAAPPAMPIAPTASAASFMIAFIVIS